MLAFQSSSTSTCHFQHQLPMELPAAALPQERMATFAGEMPRGKPGDVNFGLLTAICPPQLVDRVIDQVGQRERRCRRLPSRLLVYAVVFMCFSGLAYQKLLCHLVPMTGSWQAPNKASFARARARLGWQVLHLLFTELAVPLADERFPWASWRGRRVVAVDGTSLELDGALEDDFGGPVRGGRRLGAPLLRVAGLIECGTRAPLAAECDRWSTSENVLVERLLNSIRPGMLVLADRNFLGVKLWKAFLSRGADLVWRASDGLGRYPLERLADGSYLAKITNSHGESVMVRAVEYRLVGPDAPDTVYRLFTSILDPQAAPAAELARLYRERWEIETAFRELKSVQLRGELLRSRTKVGVLQEFWAHMVAYRISREMVYRVARSVPGQDPDQVSFSATLQVIIRSVRTAARVSGTALRETLNRAIAELGRARMLLTRRDRTSPRMVHHRQSHYRSRDNVPGPLSRRQERRPAIAIEGARGS